MKIQSALCFLAALTVVAVSQSASADTWQILKCEGSRLVEINHQDPANVVIHLDPEKQINTTIINHGVSTFVPTYGVSTLSYHASMMSTLTENGKATARLVADETSPRDGYHPRASYHREAELWTESKTNGMLYAPVIDADRFYSFDFWVPENLNSANGAPIFTEATLTTADYNDDKYGVQLINMKTDRFLISCKELPL